MLLALLMGACGGDDEGPDVEVAEPAELDFPEGSTMAQLAEAGRIRVGTKFDQPLFGLRNVDGELEGFDTEISRLIAAEMGIEPENIEWVETVSENREPFLQQGRVDLVAATYTINEERDQVIDFAGPYYVAGQDIMVAEGNPEGIQGPDDLAGKKTCTVAGSKPESNIKENYPDVPLTLFDEYSKCADALENGQVVAVTTDNVILSGFVSENEDEFDLVNKPFTEEPYGIGVQEAEDKEFCEFVNDTLEKLYENGKWAEAFEATIGTVIGEAPEPPATGSCETPGAE